MFPPPVWYYIVGIIVATIVLLVALAHATDEDKRLKAKQLIIWGLVFIISGALWPVVLLLGFLALMGNA